MAHTDPSSSVSRLEKLSHEIKAACLRPFPKPELNRLGQLPGVAEQWEIFGNAVEAYLKKIDYEISETIKHPDVDRFRDGIEFEIDKPFRKANDIAWELQYIIMRNLEGEAENASSIKEDCETVSEWMTSVVSEMKYYRLTREELTNRISIRKAFINYKPLSVDQRLEQLESFAIRHRGVGVAEFARALFPELQEQRGQAKADDNARPLPTQAPERWQGVREGGETPPAFIKRVYGEWLGKGLDRAHIRNLDRPLYAALDNWLRHHEMPADVDLPTRKEQNSRWVERVEREGLAAVIPDGSAEFVLREARRLRTIQQRRRT